MKLRSEQVSQNEEPVLRPLAYYIANCSVGGGWVSTAGLITAGIFRWTPVEAPLGIATITGFTIGALAVLYEGVTNPNQTEAQLSEASLEQPPELEITLAAEPN